MLRRPQRISCVQPPQADKQLAEKLEQWLPTKAQYTEIKQRLKAHWKDEIRIENPLCPNPKSKNPARFQFRKPSPNPIGS